MQGVETIAPIAATHFIPYIIICTFAGCSLSNLALTTCIYCKQQKSGQLQWDNVWHTPEMVRSHTLVAMRGVQFWNFCYHGKSRVKKNYSSHGTALALYLQLASYTLVEGCKVALIHSGKSVCCKTCPNWNKGSTELIAITMHPYFIVLDIWPCELGIGLGVF